MALLISLETSRKCGLNAKWLINGIRSNGISENLDILYKIEEKIKRLIKFGLWSSFVFSNQM